MIRLVGRTAHADRRALGLVFGLDDYTVKRSCAHEPAAYYADAAQRVSRVRTAMPAAAAVLALEHHARRCAGGQQAFPPLVVSDRTDVLVGQTVYYVLPGRTGIETPESAFARSYQNLTFGGEGHAVNACDVGGQRRLLPTRARVRRIENVDASGGNDQVAFGRDGDEVVLAHPRPPAPGLPLVGAYEQSGSGGREPALGCDFNVAHPRIQN